MAGNSLESVLAWMKDDARMLEWGLVVALERRKANLLIIQEYIRRFGSDSYLPAIRGDVPMVVGEWMEYVHDFVLDVPRLSFGNADLNNSTAMLTMAVMGGIQMTLASESTGWKVNKLEEIDPLQGPKLYLDLRLSNVPGDVDIDGRVKLDLKESDNFRLTFAQTAHGQRMGGDFFKDLFNQLPDEQRIYPLGQIQRGTNELMSPKSFRLWTQASPTASGDSRSTEDGNGAILALIRTMAPQEGHVPGAGYKFLIPDDEGSDYSATVLFDRKQALMGTVLSDMSGLFENASFDYEYSGKELLSVTAKSGQLVTPKIEFEQEYKHPDDGTPVNIAVKLGEFVFFADGKNPFAIDIFNDKLSVRWESLAEARGVIDPFEAPERELLVRCSFTFRAGYEVVAEADGRMSLRQTDFDMKYEIKEVTSDSAGSAYNSWWVAFFKYILDSLLLSIIPHLIINNTISQSLYVAFKERLTPEKSVNAFINETIKLNFGQAIQGNEVHAPLDVGFFGRINPTQTSFVVSPMEPLLKQGSTLKFTTEPVVPGVKWKVENVIEGADNVGKIDENSGEYQAPPADSITGRYIRARVTATAADTGYFSSALVTVLVGELTVNPLIQVCNVGGAVELAAGQLGTGELSWSIKNPVAGESGEVRRSDKPELDHTYYHGPVVANKTYVLDEIEVKSAGAARSVHVLALQKTPGLSVRIDSMDPAKGDVQLTALVNGTPMTAQWSVALGPGSIEATGLYRVPPTTIERYALIFAIVDGGPFGKFEGHLILPLPLLEFPELHEVLSQ